MSEDVATDEDQAPPRRRTGRIALLVSLGILVLLALVAVGLVWAFQSRLDANIERIPDPFEQLTDRPTQVAEDDDGDDASAGLSDENRKKLENTLRELTQLRRALDGAS